VLAETPRPIAFLAKLSSSNVKAVTLTSASENEVENQDIRLEINFTLSLAGHINIFFFRCFCWRSQVSAYCSGGCCFLLSHSLECEIVFLEKID